MNMVKTVWMQRLCTSPAENARSSKVYTSAQVCMHYIYWSPKCACVNANEPGWIKNMYDYGSGLKIGHDYIQFRYPVWLGIRSSIVAARGATDSASNSITLFWCNWQCFQHDISFCLDMGVLFIGTMSSREGAQDLRIRRVGSHGNMGCGGPSSNFRIPNCTEAPYNHCGHCMPGIRKGEE